MNEIQIIKESMKSILRELECQKYSKGAIKTHSMIYNGILKYVTANGISYIDEQVCIKYVFFRTGFKIDGFYGTGNPKINIVMKPLQVLLDYIQNGSVKFRMRSKIDVYQCPNQFEEEYSAFQEELIYREYAKSTVIFNTLLVNKFLIFLVLSIYS